MAHESSLEQLRTEIAAIREYLGRVLEGAQGRDTTTLLLSCQMIDALRDELGALEQRLQVERERHAALREMARDAPDAKEP